MVCSVFSFIIEVYQLHWYIRPRVITVSKKR